MDPTMPDPTPLDLDAIRARAEAATPGPWLHGDEYEPGNLYEHEVLMSEDLPVIEMDSDVQGSANAAFVAHARTDVPDLLAEIERLRAEADERDAYLGTVVDEVETTNARLLAERDQARAELAALRGSGEWIYAEWEYGFTNTNTGEFVHHGDEYQARALASVVRKPIQRRCVWYGPVETITEETE
jgi:hypothetical protein